MLRGCLPTQVARVERDPRDIASDSLMLGGYLTLVEPVDADPQP
jgi:hypothetical protein